MIQVDGIFVQQGGGDNNATYSPIKLVLGSSFDTGYVTDYFVSILPKNPIIEDIPVGQTFVLEELFSKSYGTYECNIDLLDFSTIVVYADRPIGYELTINGNNTSNDYSGVDFAMAVVSGKGNSETPDTITIDFTNV